MAAPFRPSLVINTFRIRAGVDPEEFVRFSAEVDQPTLLGLGDVVRRFNVHRVAAATEGAALAADIVEIMEVSDWAIWTELRDGHPSLDVVTRGFDKLVDPDSVRSSFVVPVMRGHSA